MTAMPQHRLLKSWARLKNAVFPASSEKASDREYARLPLRRLWRLLWQPNEGRMGHTIRLTITSLTGIMIGEIWHIPMMVMVPILLLALWAEDRVTNIVIGIVVFFFFLIVMGLLYLAILMSVNNYFLTLFVNLAFSFMFFYLASASKLSTIAVMGGLILSYFLMTLEQIPVSDLITRFLLYGWMVIAIAAAMLVGMGLLIAPSPERVLTGRIACRLRLAAKLLRTPDDLDLREDARDIMLLGATPMLVNIKMAGLEKMWAPKALNRLRQAALHSFGILAIVDTATRKGLYAPVEETSACAALLDEMAQSLAKNALPTVPTPPVFTTPLLRQIGGMMRDFSAFSDEALPKPPKKSGFFVPTAFTSPEHSRFAIKGSLSVLISLLIYKSLNWPGIHTCIITCFIVSLPTMGEVIAKQRLRIVGALIGCSMAGLATVFLIPHFINVAQLTLMLGLGILAGGWVKCGDQRIAYAGLQIVLASYLSDLTAFKPPTDLTVPRDRVIGILIGLAVSYVITTRFWPLSAGKNLPALFTALNDQLTKLNLAPTPLLRLAAAAKVFETISATERMLEYNALEPAPYCPPPTQLGAYRTALLHAGSLTEDLLTAPMYPADPNESDLRFNAIRRQTVFSSDAAASSEAKEAKRAPRAPKEGNLS